MTHTRLYLLAFLTTLLTACGDSDTPEDRIAALINNFEQTAEQGKALGFRDYIADTYTDRDGMRKPDVLRLLAGYKLRNKSIHLLVHIADITVAPDQKSGSAKVFVAMAASPVTGIEQLAGLEADLYRFDIQLHEDPDGAFQVSSAEWAPAEKADFISID